MRILSRYGYAWMGALAALGVGALTVSAATTNSMQWNRENDRVDADMRGVELWPLLEEIARTTGWQVFVEPGCSHTASVKFRDLPPGQALRMLLGDLNFAFMPQTNAASRLYVFRTGRQNATQYVFVARDTPGARRVPNELIVKLKPGVNVDDLARKLGAKVLGCIAEMNVCRLQFADAAAADTARDQLAHSSDVAAVDYNYYIDRPTPVSGLASGGAAFPQLTLNPPPDSGRIVVGLVDTEVQPLCGDLNNFLLKPISVAGEASPGGDTPSHGTAMADAVLRGLATATGGRTSVQILPVNVYGPNATTTTFDVASGIVQAVNHGANVINLSLGGTGDSPFLQSLIQTVHARGIPIFAAAGNEPVTTPFYPAAYPGVIAVTAVDQGQIAPYANRGSFVAVGAPGSEAFCYNGQTYLTQGTSAASAYTTGKAAGLADANHLNWNQVQQVILKTMAVTNRAGL